MASQSKIVHTIAVTFAGIALTFIAACKEKPPAPLSQEFPLNAMVVTFENFVPLNDKSLYWCLEVDGKDPSNMALAAMRAKGANVAAASECTYNIDEPGSVHDGTGQLAEFVRLRRYKRITKNQAEIQYSKYRHGMWGSFGICQLEYFHGEWIVSCKSMGVS